jgi:GGDEF domain-containing protein
MYFPTINAETTQLMKMRIKEKLEHHLYIYGKIQFSITISIGESSSVNNSLLKEIIEEADMKCFLEKQKHIEEQFKNR